MADRYWVGGAGTWDATAGTKWAETSGGAGGETVPTASDNVFIDANSGAVTVTVGTGAVCANLSFTSGAGAFTGTLAGSAALTISGGLTLVSGMTITHSGGITFNATASGNAITSAGKVIDGSFTFNGAGGEWQLQDNLTLGSGRSVALTAGTLDIANQTVECHTIASNNSNTRAIKFGTGQLNLRANNANVINMATATGFIYTGTPTINATYSGAVGTRSFVFGSSAGGSEANAMNLNISAGTDVVLVSNHFKNLSFVGFSGTINQQSRTIYGDLTLSSTMTFSAGTDTMTFAGTSGTSVITCNNTVIDMPVNFNGVGKGWRFGGTFRQGATRTFRLTNGTVDGDGENAIIGIFALSSGTKTLTLGSGTWTVAGTSWDANTNVTNLTVSASTGTISMTSASSKTFAGGGKTWPTLNQGGAGALTIQQANTFANITNSVQPATITFQANTTTTVSAFGVSGTSGNLITLNSSSAGTLATLSDASGVNSVSFCDIKDINATGGASWIAFTENGNVNSGNNAGWEFARQFGRYIYTRRKNKRIFP